MAASFILRQDGGAGDGAVNGDLTSVRSGLEIEAEALAVYASYAWSFVARPSGASLPTITGDDEQIATFTLPAVRGTWLLRLTEPAGSRTVAIRVTRDAAGDPLGLLPNAVAPAVGERSIFSPSFLGRGVQRLWEILIEDVEEAIEAGGGGGGSGTVTEVTASAPISVADGTTTPALSIANGAIAIAKLANIATARFLGRTAAGSGVPEELTGTQATALMDEASGAAKGLLSTAFWNLLDGATAAATALALVRRDSNADIAVRRLTVTDQISSAGAIALVPGGAMTLGVTSQDAAINCFSFTGSCATGGVIWYAGNRTFLFSDYNAATEITIRLPAPGQTTNATPAALADISVSAKGGTKTRVIRARATISGVRHRATWTFRYDAHLDAGGAAVWTGGEAPVAVDFAASAGLAACQAELTLSSNVVRSMVTGISAVTIDWSDTEEMKS